MAKDLMVNQQVTNTFLMLSIINKCIKKADTSGDGVLSEEEISAFLEKGHSELLTEIQKESINDNQTLDLDELEQIFNVVKKAISSSADISEQLPELKDISKEDFINNASEAKEDEEASAFWKIIGAGDAESIFSSIDIDGDEILSEEEISSISNFDGSDKDVSLTDLYEFFKADEKSLLKEEEKEEVESEAEVSETPQTDFDSGSVSSSGGGYYDGGSVDSSSNVDNVQEKTRTKEDVEKETTEQETLKDTVSNTAKEKIKEQEDLILKAIQESDLSDEFKAEYDSENNKISGLIKNKENEINEQRKLEQDYIAQSSSYKAASASIDAQISTMKSERASLDSSKDGEKIKEYDTKIQNLTDEKARLDKAQAEAEQNAFNAKTAAQKAEKEKNDLNTEKDNLLDTLAEKHKVEKEKIDVIKEQIKQYQDNIKEVETQLQTDLSTINSNIQTLKTEKAQIIQDEKTKEIIDTNRVKADTTPATLSGDISNYDWKSLGYNEEYGKQLLEGTIEATKQLKGSKNNCLGGVKRGFKIAFGEDSPFGAEGKGITRAGRCLGTMQNSENFREIKGISIDQAKNLPAGTIIVWEGTDKDSDDVVLRCGHIAVLDGTGKEASGGRYGSMYKHVAINKPHYFIPVAV